MSNIKEITGVSLVAYDEKGEVQLSIPIPPNTIGSVVEAMTNALDELFIPSGYLSSGPGLTAMAAIINSQQAWREFLEVQEKDRR